MDRQQTCQNYYMHAAPPSLQDSQTRQDLNVFATQSGEFMSYPDLLVHAVDVSKLLHACSSTQPAPSLHLACKIPTHAFSNMFSRLQLCLHQQQLRLHVQIGSVIFSIGSSRSLTFRYGVIHFQFAHEDLTRVRYAWESCRLGAGQVDRLT